MINMIAEMLERNKNKKSRAEAPRLNALRCPSELNGAGNGAKKCAKIRAFLKALRAGRAKAGR
jgi:hypothetical protein